ncbi:MAG TPA: ribonuclease H-like domain-containing protein [Thermoplasmata archaeon]|nr:ribonuclease H-like domain-containing protein [Thermoplasmata archaeon]
MLRSTFLHLTGVGPVTESDLWQRGVLSWDDFRSAGGLTGLSPSRRQRLERELRASEEALVSQDAGYFARRLPMSEHWRIYPSFASATAFLDIETTSLSPYEGIVTVVSVHGGGSTRTFVADDNLEELPACLRRFGVLVTFNGSMFDVPFLRVRFPEIVVPPAHVDLRFVLYRLGLAGGLKRIEARLGLGDRTGVEGIGGLDAVRLWEQYRRGSPEALTKLVRYNRADTVNLEPLADFAVRELTRRLLGAATADGRRRAPRLSTLET